MECARSRVPSGGVRRRSRGSYGANAATRGGKLDYRASVAHWKAELFARRPKAAKLAENERVREYVKDRLSGRITMPGGDSVSGPLERQWKGLNRPHRPRPPMGESVDPRADFEGRRSISRTISQCGSATRPSTSPSSSRVVVCCAANSSCARALVVLCGCRGHERNGLRGLT